MTQAQETPKRSHKRRADAPASDVTADLGADRPRFETIAQLSELSGGNQIQVLRTQPTCAKGFCGHVIVPEDGLGDLMEQIQHQFGGGTYSLQAKIMSPNGKLVFGRGAVQVSVAGEPLFQGRRWVNGILEPANSPVQAQPVMMQGAPAAASESNQQMLSLLGTVLQTALAGDGRGQNIDLAGLVKSVGESLGSSGAAPQGNALGQVESIIGLISKLRRLDDERGGESDPEPQSDSSELFGGGGWEKMLMMKLMGDSSQAAQAPGYPPWPGYPPQYSGPRTGYPPHPHYPPPYPGPPGPAQSAAPPGVPPQYPQPPPRGQYGQPPPPSDLQASRFAVDPQGNAAEQPKPDAGDAQGDDEDDVYEVTPDDVIAELASRDDAGKQEFLSECLDKLGMDPQQLLGLANMLTKQQSQTAPPLQFDGKFKAAE